MIDKNAALAWAEKVIKSKPPRYTDASRNAAAVILADAKIIKAAEELADAVYDAIDKGSDVSDAQADRVDVAIAAYRAAVSERDT